MRQLNASLGVLPAVLLTAGLGVRADDDRHDYRTRARISRASRFQA